MASKPTENLKDPYLLKTQSVGCWLYFDLFKEEGEELHLAIF